MTDQDFGRLGLNARGSKPGFVAPEFVLIWGR